MKQPRCGKNWLRSILIFACISFVACGGGGIGDLASSGGVGGSGVTGGGVGGTGVSAGSVTAIGSVHVNGVRFDTTQAEIFVEGQSQGFGDPIVFSHLKVGMVVRVEGEIEDPENGTADRVYFSDDLRGPVASVVAIDPATYQLVVLGKTVIIDELTQVTNVTIDAGLIGAWIQVSGFEDAEGRIRATFVTATDDTSGANLKGTITAVDPINQRITINGLAISYQHAILIDIDDLIAGQLVEVTGDYSTGPVTIDADTIERVDFLGAADIETIEISGIITAKITDTEFLLNGVPVVVDAQTLYSGGDPDDIAVDLRVEAEGQLIAGQLYAERIVFMDFAKVESDVLSNDPGPSVITLRGLADIPIRYNDFTKVTGAVTDTGAIDATLHVKIIGRRLPPAETESVLAIHVITKSGLDDKVIVQGALEADPPVNQTTITLLDHVIDISGIPDDNFESPGGTGYVAFTNSTEAGDIVSAKGMRTGANVTWQSLSVE